MEYKFQPGDVFKLKPTAKIKWLAFSIGHSGIQAIRCDSPIGIRLLEWMGTRSDADRPSYSAVRCACKGFWPEALESAVKA